MGLFDFLDPMSGAAMAGPASRPDFSNAPGLFPNGIPPWLLGLPQLGGAMSPGSRPDPEVGTFALGAPISGPMPYHRASQDMPGFGPDLAPPPSPFDTARPGGPSYGPGDGSALPPNATPTTNIPPQGGPPQGPPVSGPAPPSFLDKLMGGISSNSNTLMALGAGLAGAPSWGTGISRALQGAMPASQLDQKMQAQNFATEALIRKGVSPQEAQAIATNPDILKQVLAQLYGPKTAPTLGTIHGPQGQQSAYWDPQKGRWLDPLTQRPVAAPAPGPSNSPFSATPVPPGVDADSFRKAEATRLADAEKDLRVKGEGSLEFLPDALRVLDKVQTPRANEAVGPIVGHPKYNEYVRGYLGSLDPTGTARANLGTYNELSADLKRLSTSNLKAQFGGRITNVEIGQNNATFGGLQSADQATSARILSERVRDSFENLNRNLDAGFIKPSSVPPEVAQKGVALGFLNPQHFPGIKPAAQTAPSGGSDGWVDMGGGVRIREKR